MSGSRSSVSRKNNDFHNNNLTHKLHAYAHGNNSCETDYPKAVTCWLCAHLHKHKLYGSQHGLHAFLFLLFSLCSRLVLNVSQGLIMLKEYLPAHVWGILRITTDLTRWCQRMCPIHMNNLNVKLNQINTLHLLPRIVSIFTREVWKIRLKPAYF